MTIDLANLTPTVKKRDYPINNWWWDIEIYFWYRRKTKE